MQGNRVNLDLAVEHALRCHCERATGHQRPIIGVGPGVPSLARTGRFTLIETVWFVNIYN